MSRSVLLILRNVSDNSRREIQNTHVENFYTACQATDDRVEYANCILDN